MLELNVEPGILILNFDSLNILYVLYLPYSAAFFIADNSPRMVICLVEISFFVSSVKIVSYITPI